MKSPVSIVRCASYEAAALDRALARAAELAPLPELRGASVLVKPNILIATDPDRAVTTHPEFLRAFIRLLRSRGASRVMAGDSPGWQPQDLTGRRTGLKDAAESEGAEWADFSEGSEREFPEGRRIKRCTLAAALDRADLLVSLPKLKTHGLVRYTGAIKNLFGLVPGLGKSAYHLRFPELGDFGSMLVDIALAARPAYAMMDAVVAMEGHGPSNGHPVRLGLVLGSPDLLALDWTAASIIGYDPRDIGYLLDAMSRAGASANAGASAPAHPWVGESAGIEVRGESVEAVRPASFELVRGSIRGADIFASKLPPMLHRAVKNLSSPRPYFHHRACLRCGACVRICPPRALTLESPGRGREPAKPRIAIDRSACIRCYCCDEVCPTGAIHLRRRPW